MFYANQLFRYHTNAVFFARIVRGDFCAVVANDMIEALEMMSDGRLNPTAMITHIGGLDAVVDTVINLDKIPGGKKLIYNFISMPLVALADLAELGKTDPLYRELAVIVENNNGMWCAEAEKYLLANAKPI